MGSSASGRAEITPNNTSGRSAASLFWPTTFLVLALVIIKATYVGLSAFWTWATPKDYMSLLYAQWLAAMSMSDIVFAVAAGIIAAVILFLVRRSVRLSKFFWIAFVAFAAACVFYGVVGRQVYSYYSAPLTYQLLTLGGEPRTMWSSIEPFVTLRTMIVLVAAPLAYAVISVIVARPDSPRARPSRTAIAIVLIIIVASLGIGRQFRANHPTWFIAQDRHLSESPHVALLASAFSAFGGTNANLGKVAVLDGDRREFSTVAGVSSFTTATTRPKNVILIVLESVGSQYLSLYGSKYNTTPRLVGEQANAVTFDNYYAPVAWTAYSLMALVLSQRPPMERYNTNNFRAGTLSGQSIAEALRASGYTTGFIAAGDPDWAGGGNFLESHGFQQIIHGKELAGAKKVSSWGTEDRFMFRRMLEWIDQNRQHPFFLMGWTDQTHNPYPIGPDQSLIDVMPADSGTKNLRNYLSLVREADSQIGALLDSLRSRGLADSTLVVITGDHGEAFGQYHGGNGHGFTVYDEEVHVPLMIWNPVLFAKGARSDVLGSHQDLAPTMLDILGIAAPHEWQGRSLFDRSRSPRTYMFAAAWGEYLLGVREGSLKYIYDARAGDEELYDLSTDPHEQKNVVDQKRGLAARLRQRLAAWLEVQRARRVAGVK